MGADGTITLAFALSPSDPDFPFELDALQCELQVPAAYPSTDRPRLRVNNKEMGRGYQLNIERGFDALVAQQSASSTLLGLMNALDRQLEQLLAAPKVETLKLVANASKAPAISGEGPLRTLQKQSAPADVADAKPTADKAPSYTPAQLADARSRREAETRQLEARLGRLSQFRKSRDGTEYIVPLEPRKRNELPVPLQGINSVQLTVPLAYNLEPCRITIPGMDIDSARNIELAFAEDVAKDPQLSLMSRVNNLAQNMHRMALQSRQPEPETPSVDSRVTTTDQRLSIDGETQATQQRSDTPGEADRAHVITIPRPPEWDARDEDDSETDSSTDYDSTGESDNEEGYEPARDSAETTRPISVTAERGVSVSFPSLELYGIELLELCNLSVTVKCDRCKDTLDVHNLKDNVGRDYSGMRSESCKKCANPLGIGAKLTQMRSQHPKVDQHHRLQNGPHARAVSSCWLSRS